MIKVLSAQQIRTCDKFTIENISSERDLIKNAAKALFEAGTYTPPVCIVCGKGNNGADGLALAPLLNDANIKTEICLVEDSLSKEGEFFFNKCKSSNIPYFYLLPTTDLSVYKTVVDCVLGTGFKNTPIGNSALAISKINSSNAYVISADINSGLNSDNGIGKLCVKSDITVSLGEYKYGHFLNDSKDVIKTKTNKDIGIDGICSSAYLIENADVSGIFEERKFNSHKGTFGYVTIIGGCRDYSGAPKLANLAACALRSGCGVCKLAIPRCIANAVAPYLLESTLLPMPSNNDTLLYDEKSIEKAIDKAACVSIGMGIGIGKEQEQIISYILDNYQGNLIIDADGINNLSNLSKNALKHTHSNVVLTPHVKEFSRLASISVEDIINDPIGSAKQYAKENNVTLLLKGVSTVITDGINVYISDKGTHGMATAGSGDVLSGILTGLLGYTTKEKIALATAAGAYLNGLCGEFAADEFTPVGMLSSDTAKNIPKALKYIFSL